MLCTFCFVLRVKYCFMLLTQSSDVYSHTSIVVLRILRCFSKNCVIPCLYYLLSLQVMPSWISLDHSCELDKSGPQSLELLWGFSDLLPVPINARMLTVDLCIRMHEAFSAIGVSFFFLFNWLIENIHQWLPWNHLYPFPILLVDLSFLLFSALSPLFSWE